MAKNRRYQPFTQTIANSFGSGSEFTRMSVAKAELITDNWPARGKNISVRQSQEDSNPMHSEFRTKTSEAFFGSSPPDVPFVEPL